MYLMAAPQPELTPKPDIVRRRAPDFLLRTDYALCLYRLHLLFRQIVFHCFIHSFIHSINTHVVGQSEYAMKITDYEQIRN